jgi:hypothetical protein
MSEVVSDAKKRYWAFISYSHHDKKYARWLRAGLSKKRCPRRCRDLVVDGSKRFPNVFLDEEEARAGSRLDDALQQALQESRFLIVICSPFAVASDHVSDETRHFKSLGGGDRIL